MIYIPFYFFFFINLIFGRLISVSSGNWLYIWMGLEINLLSFIPLIARGVNEIEVERSLKYFLVQALGSSLILFGCFTLCRGPNAIFSSYIGDFILFFSILIKIGIFPFHYWLPHVIGGISWISCILLSIWQKFGPLFIIRGLVSNIYISFLLLIGRLGSIVGGLGGINQSQIRILLAYSSIGHISWILIGIFCSFNILLYYYIIYRFIIISIILLICFYPIKMININRYIIFPLYIIILLSILFLSLGGLPPFLGFYPKLTVIISRSINNMYFCLFILILGSLINIFYYLSIFFNLFMKSIFCGFNNRLIMLNKYQILLISIFFIASTFSLFLIL